MTDTIVPSVEAAIPQQYSGGCVTIPVVASSHISQEAHHE